MTVTHGRVVPLLYTVAGVVGVVSSFVLTWDKWRIAIDPTFVPSCSINEAINCSPVMQSEQAAAFGFPNPWLGLVGFGAMLALGVAMLAGAQFARWFWVLCTVATGAATVFVHWLILSAVFDIHALCPWCMAVWVVTVVAFWWSLLVSLRLVGEGADRSFFGRLPWAVPVLWAVALIVLLVVQFAVLA